MPTVELLTKQDLTAVRRILSELELPTADLQRGENRFFGIFENDHLVACGGLQAAGRAALLRSLAVLPAWQGQGLGRQLVDYMVWHAAESDFEAVYLLTETSAGFFESLDFRRVARGNVPAAITATAQFSELCPDSAICLMKVLHSREISS